MPVILPSAEELGTRTPQPRTNVVQTTGGAAIGRALEGAGNDVTRTAQTIQEKQDKVELARAKSYWLSEQVKANSDFENDQDYTTMEARYKKRMLEAKASAVGMLSNKGDQELFNLDLKPDYDRGVAAVKTLSYKRTVDTGRANFRTSTDSNLQSLLQAPDEESRSSIIKAQQDLIAANKERGFLTAEEKQKEATDFVQNYAVQRGQLEMESDPKATLKLLKPTAANRDVSNLSLTTSNKYKGVSPTFLTTVAAIETGGTFDPQSTNKSSGARGLFQITPGTAKDLGVRDPHNPDESADATARLAVQNTKTLSSALGRKPTDAELYLAHQQGGAGASALLKNPDENVVDALAKAYDGNKAKARAAVVQNGGDTSGTAKAFSSQWMQKYNDFEGKYTGVQVASLNTKGVLGNAPKEGDAAGTLPHFEKTGTWVDYLPYDKRIALINSAETKVRQNRTINKQLLDTRVKDANAMALQGFQDPNPPSFADFEDSYEGAEAELRYREYADTQKVAGKVHQAATMSPGEQATTLVASKPQPGPGFAKEQENYETLQKGITEANTARKADPIAFAQKYQLAPSAAPLNMKDPQAFTQQLSQRGSLGVSMTHDYSVPLRVFTEPEAEALSTMLNGQTANQRLSTLTIISAGLQDNPVAYTAAMGQLRPASPVTAYAGTYLGLKGSITDAKNLSVTPQSVASGILQGEDLINPPKDSEGKETKPAIKMPSPEGSTFTGGMRSDFNEIWGASFQGQPQSANDVFEASRSYYAYLSAQAGEYDGKYDSVRYEQAMKAVMGNSTPVVMGDSAVIAPWGMPEDKFLDGAKVAFNRVVSDQGLKNWNFDDVSFLGTGRPGEYTVQNGTMNMVDKKGFPLVVKVTDEDVEMVPGLGIPRSILEDNRRRYGNLPYAGQK